VKANTDYTDWSGFMFQDLRYGIRMLLKKPGFTLVGARRDRVNDRTRRGVNSYEDSRVDPMVALREE
jgi:hypothetical protein